MGRLLDRVKLTIVKHKLTELPKQGQFASFLKHFNVP